MPQLCFVSISTTKLSEDRGESVDENPEKEKSVIFSWRNDVYSSLTTRQLNVMYAYAPQYKGNLVRKLVSIKDSKIQLKRAA